MSEKFHWPLATEYWLLIHTFAKDFALLKKMIEK